MSLPRILIADDHKVVAEGLVRLLAPHYDIVDTIGDGSLVLNSVRQHRPDVLLLDMSMPGISGLEVLHQLRDQRIQCKVIVLTMYAEANIAVQALRAGASGFVLKESSGDELLIAIEMVLSGGTYLAAGLTKDIVTAMVGAPEPNCVELTAHQQEVLRLVVRGMRAKEIAETLQMSTRSVEAIKYKTMQLLNVHSTAELVRYTMEHRLVSF
jgi:DNA-binding NarL/FixJ family response regulator